MNNNRFTTNSRNEVFTSKWYLWAKNKSNEVDQKALELQKRGHVCVRILESFPPRLSWCGVEPCKYAKK